MFDGMCHSCPSDSQVSQVESGASPCWMSVPYCS